MRSRKPASPPCWWCPSPPSGAEALRVPISARDRLLRECWAMVEQPRTLDRNRIGEGPLTRLSAAEMDALEQALRAALGLADT